ncbi:sugar phosphate isomerase/epimerase [Collinsella sp. AGMB00827]|uniref:Sugar phosphate isomerase/epimerase n=1 Tax=Collinsella ureilytica TaxID=2869515 RepID=A0ABS7MM45_9ACTN|nr:sugar phosphate isomerase/epimerase family protein [Collinsella urealyticum]MBY4798367.1 sugar phosphate isomerase/epimerase [Collinsella urealyticum]
MKAAARINSYFREGKKDVERVFTQFEEAGLTHVDLNYPEHTSGIEPARMKQMLEASHLELNGVALRFRSDFINGELGNADPAIAQHALKLCREACDYCREAGGSTVTVWLGFDGFDYSFQIAYDRVFKQLVRQFTAICDYAPDLNISIEYKPFEERSYAFIDSMGLVSMILTAVNKPNLGVTLDYCHMLMKHENPAMAADLFGAAKKLYGIHLNDGYGVMDDGLMIGMATPIKTLELLFYLKKHGYDKAIYFDTFPIIEGAVEESEQNVRMLAMLSAAIDWVGLDEIQAVIDKNDAIAAAGLVRKFFGAMEGDAS